LFIEEHVYSIVIRKSILLREHGSKDYRLMDGILDSLTSPSSASAAHRAWRLESTWRTGTIHWIV